MAVTRPKSFHEQIVETLGRRIVSGEIAPQGQVPTEAALAESLGVGRLALREAMKALAARGLVVIRPKTGTHVLPREHWNLFDPLVLKWHTQAAAIDRKFLADLIELRRVIEPAAARLAAANGSDADIALMRESFEAMVAARTREDYIQADLRFHGMLLKASGNQFIGQLAGALSEVLKTSFSASSTHSADAAALGLHEDLLRACEARDPQAADQAVQALIARAVRNIASGQVAQGGPSQA
ncbi:Transcriptional regulator, GntR family [plant metagenome]|uniref:Transcriptional regulator, GntR family n=1 Tax=plant metagenome TaxID=1297885 RepID=A0A484PNT2_9ZZZZ